MHRACISVRKWLLSAGAIEPCSSKKSLMCSAVLKNVQSGWNSGVKSSQKAANQKQGDKWNISIGTGSNAIPLGNAKQNDMEEIAEQDAEEEGLTEYEKRVKNVNRCLKVYMEKRADYEKMMVGEREQFELGKRHLANIMGWNPEMKVSQKQIDRAIEYLFPSNLHDQKAVPVMKPPELILPKISLLDFDEEGRPMDPFFFTTKPKFYKALSDLNDKTQTLVHQYDKLLSEDTDSETIEWENKMDLSSSEWINIEDIIEKFGEKISNEMYENFLSGLDYLVSLPLAHTEERYIQSWRQSKIGAQGGGKKLFGCKIPVVRVSKKNRRFTVVITKAKNCHMKVTVQENGSGKIVVNGIPFDEFRSLQVREILLCPMLITDLIGKIDVEATLLENASFGESVGPRATRHGTSLGIAALFPEKKEILRLSGLLTLDLRKKERQKINQSGARSKWIWKKR